MNRKRKNKLVFPILNHVHHNTNMLDHLFNQVLLNLDSSFISHVIFMLNGMYIILA